MKYGILYHGRRVPHGRETQHFDKIPDPESPARLRKNAKSLALALKKQRIALLVAHDAAHPHPVARALRRRKPQQLREWNFCSGGLHFNKAQTRNVEQDARKLTVGVVQAAAHALDQHFAVDRKSV